MALDLAKRPGQLEARHFELELHDSATISILFSFSQRCCFFDFFTFEIGDSQTQ